MTRGWFILSLLVSLAGHGIAAWYWQNASTDPPVLYVEVGEVSVDIESARSATPAPASTPGKESPEKPTPRQTDNAHRLFLAVEEAWESSLSEIAHLGAKIESAAETVIGKVVEQAKQTEKPIVENEPRPEPTKESTIEPAPLGAVASTPQQAAIGTSERKKGVRTEAKRRDGVRLAYPAEALKKRLEGRVMVRLEIDVHGRVSRAEVVKSSGHAVLDEAALHFSRRVEFDPATEDGIPVPTVRNQSYDFHDPYRR